MRKETNMKRCNVGGQAVMEGVMMRSPTGIAMAVRRADGKIVTQYSDHENKAKKGTFLGLPVVRGCVAFIDSLTTGYRTIMDSANMYGEDAFKDEEPSKFEKWLAKTFGKDIEDVVMGFALVLGILLAVGLFIFLPQLISSLIFGSNTGVWRSLVEGVLRVGIYIGYLFLCSAMKETKRLFMYHGAEHKTIACYEAEDELTPENAMKHTRLHPRCGTNYLFLVMAVSILFFAIVGWNDSLLVRVATRLIFLPVVAGLSYELLKFAARHENLLTRIIRAPGMGLQYITTKEPTPDMIEVAMEAFHLAMLSEDEAIARVAERNAEIAAEDAAEAEKQAGTEAPKAAEAAENA